MSIPESLQPFVTNKLVHKTWAGTFFCKPQAIFQPRNLDEIKELINQARQNGKTIMTVGSGHSPSDLTMTTEWLCNLDKFNSVIKQEEFYGQSTSNPAEKEVKFVDLTVEAGCRIFELNDYLKKHKLAIQNLGSISDQSIAGLISTGTHGSTQYHGLVSQQVVSISFLNAEANLITCNSVENPDYFRAALLSLGKIGIITHVTLRTCPSYTIKSKQEIIRFDTLLSNWENIWLDSEFIRIWWFPYSGNCVCWRASKSDDPLSDPRPSWYGTRFGRFFYESLLWVSVHILPRLTPFVEKFVFEQQYGKVETLGKGDIAVQHSVDGLNMDCLFSQFVNEWSAPLVKGQDVLLKLRKEILEAAEKGDFFVHAPIEVRCSNVTNSNSPFIDEETFEPSLYPPKSWLAKRDRLSAGPIPGNNFRPFLDNSPYIPFAGEGATVTNDQLTMFVNATMYRPFGTNVETHQWFQIFENIMGDAGGKPHWAKNFIGIDGDQKTEQDLKTQLDFGGKPFYTMIGFNPVMKDWFGENLVKYNQVRRETDPSGVFLSGKSWAIRNGILLD
ncbi:D-arabinono-1,4-lactone oxidase (ALO) (L-galactono-gamma-lactone oxidase) [Scheffersomyces stipitis CBS 6054]|uniref:D-arabinono-1,4-lactone oxidase n=1 Tax=Scheffersomyces stipitis (strain ATCC 58785 / CBS 6054 / NBRC 10063 / NRRL Y-11545) TaxID=322104 RepID=A3LS45_PICST|nr:D-arabinono-1,4-lactone oxidase (ALO) (L-galactono-gamma-lactone oxidase) [Scheffersomyces stipitis CBS 6054]ABN65843.1 D-arabinono-1,4-lactone oxidase (ALO) (L-galactono-gamma-lactone oxidase) [Scheffersomyces stipitis CBS 6054]